MEERIEMCIRDRCRRRVHDPAVGSTGTAPGDQAENRISVCADLEYIVTGGMFRRTGQLQFPETGSCAGFPFGKRMDAVSGTGA